MLQSEQAGIKFIGVTTAFKSVTYNTPYLSNTKFLDLYKEGFELKKEVIKIKEAALSLGKNGDELSIPSEYKKGEIIFEHYHEEGYKVYEEERTDKIQVGAIVLFLIAAGWAGRRFM